MINMLLYQISVCTTNGKIEKSHKTINLKYQFQRGMKSLVCLIDCILYQAFKIILNMSLKKTQKRPIIFR